MIPADIGMSSPRCLACRKWSCKTGASAVSARCAKVAAGIIWFRSRSRRGNRGLFCSWNDACRRDMVLAVSDGKLILFCRKVCLHLPSPSQGRNPGVHSWRSTILRLWFCTIIIHPWNQSYNIIHKYIINIKYPQCSPILSWHGTGPVGAVIGGTLAIAATAGTAHRARHARMELNISSISMWRAQGMGDKLAQSHRMLCYMWFIYIYLYLFAICYRFYGLSLKTIVYLWLYFKLKLLNRTSS